MRNRRRLAVLTGLLVLAAVPVIGHWARQTRDGRCALDGVPVVPIYRVRVRDAGGADHAFCCIRCADLWLGRQTKPPAGVWVTDETGGSEIRAGAAHFARSAVVTTLTTGNRIHAFARQADAERHAEAAHGRLLTDDERPFAALP